MNNSLILVISMVTLVIVLFFGLLRIRKKVIIKKVKQRTDEEKLKDINEALSIYGFLFDVQQGIVYSSINPNQRKLGYCTLYDEFAPSLNMIIDCEPIYFEYDGKRWLIEFWKGQYGVTTGAEVGIYATDKNDVDIPGIFTGTFYECVSDQELLLMQYTLNKSGNTMIKRKAIHWWLTGFDVGIFSNKEQLSMEIQINFPDFNMKKEFIKGLYYAGYNTNEIIVKDQMVQILFTTPKTKQPQKYNTFIVGCIQKLNRFYCNLFNWITRDFTRTLDKIDFLRMYYPILFSIIDNSKRAKKLEKLYNGIQDYIKE